MLNDKWTPREKMFADPEAALYELGRMAALVDGYGSRLRVLEHAVRGRDLKAILDREERRGGERVKVFVSDLRGEVFSSNDEAAQLNEISGEAWETAEWMRSIHDALERHLSEARPAAE